MCDYCEDDTGTRPPYIEDVALRIPQLEIRKDEEGMLGATVVSVADRPDDLENYGVFTICPCIDEDTGEYCGLTAQLKMVPQNDQDGGGAPCIFDSKIAAMKWVEYSLQTHDQDDLAAIWGPDIVTALARTEARSFSPGVKCIAWVDNHYFDTTTEVMNLADEPRRWNLCVYGDEDGDAISPPGGGEPITLKVIETGFYIRQYPHTGEENPMERTLYLHRSAESFF